MENYNNENEIIDVTGTPLTPGSFEKCLGNVKYEGIECCCDNCDYFIICVLKSEVEEWQELRQEILDSHIFADVVKYVLIMKNGLTKAPWDSRAAMRLTHDQSQKERRAMPVFLFGAGSGIRTHVGCPKRFSRPPRYDRFDIPAYELVNTQD